jgi:sugar lactone lactonase YvrE
MYFIDSPTQRVDVFDFDPQEGAISNRRAFAKIDSEHGMPDGLTVDADGGVWVCLFGGAAVRRYDAHGDLDAHIELPVPHPTCPAFGGPDLSTLFVTTTRHRLNQRQRQELPEAGGVFALSPGIAGCAAPLYRHRPEAPATAGPRGYSKKSG